MTVTKKIVLVILLLIFISLSIAYMIYSFPIPIHRNYAAVECDMNDENNTKNISVTLDGQYYKSLFNRVSYKGKIMIEGYDLTQKTNAISSIVLNNGIGGSPLFYKTPFDDAAEGRVWGRIFWGQKLNRLSINIYDINATEVNIIISSSVESRDEAINQYHELNAKWKED